MLNNLAARSGYASIDLAENTQGKPQITSVQNADNRIRRPLVQPVLISACRGFVAHLLQPRLGYPSDLFLGSRLHEIADLSQAGRGLPTIFLWPC